VVELDQDPVSGTTFAERYVAEAWVAEGGTGRIYRGYDWRSDRHVAIKVLFGDLSADQLARARLVREATMASRLHHPNIVRIFDIGESPDGLVFLVMDFVAGPTLDTRIRGQGPIPATEALRLTRAIAEGLEHAHAHGLVHRDLKTPNVILQKDREHDRPMITDFGVAMVKNAPADDRLTGDGLCVGTPGWMSPEQATGQVVDHRSDLFNLGLLLYEMVAGVPPFEGTAHERNQLVVTQPLPMIAYRNPRVSVPPEIDQLLHGLLQKRREHRVQTASDAIRMIDLLVSNSLEGPSTKPDLPSVLEAATLEG
jgi:serine/threonine protein kinase